VVRKKSAARKPARGAARSRPARPAAKPRQER
jgi:hypothetical protein